jgi:hypothetical protein
MKHLLTSLMLLVAMSTTAKVDTDTVGIDQSSIKQIITNTTTNSKGKQITKHYAVVNGYLCTISKTVINKITLCKRYKCTHD